MHKIVKQQKISVLFALEVFAVLCRNIDMTLFLLLYATYFKKNYELHFENLFKKLDKDFLSVWACSFTLRKWRGKILDDH